MFKLEEWNENLKLDNFYRECCKRGYINNSSQKKMIDCFRNESVWNAWILYKDNTAIGCVAAHSFDDIMGQNSYRVLTRTCAFSEYSPVSGLLTKNKMIAQHQHFSDQFFLPKCIEWCNSEKIYVTSNESNKASQRQVNNIYFPTMKQLGLVKHVKKIYYRGLEQNIWQIFPKKFLDHLDNCPKWNLAD
jgi:hypothetical protein